MGAWKRRLLIALGTLAAAAVVYYNIIGQLAYRNGRPTAIGRRVNDWWAALSETGLLPPVMISLETRGRRSGETKRVALVAAKVGGETYLVSMLGEASDWVRNVRASGGQAVVRRKGPRPVVLEDVPVEERAPILRSYLRLARGAHRHFPIPPGAPLSAFEAIAAEYPAFRVVETKAGDRS